MAPKRSQKSLHCDQCGKPVKRDLARHKRSHAPPIFRCPWPVCKGRGFRQRSNIIHHVEKWHFALRKHVCPHEWVDEHGRIAPCAAHFDEGSVLTRHRREQHGYVPGVPDQVYEIRPRSSAQQAEDRHYYQVVVAERMAARLADAGLPPVGWEESVYGPPSLKEPVGHAEAQRKPDASPAQPASPAASPASVAASSTAASDDTAFSFDTAFSSESSATSVDTSVAAFDHAYPFPAASSPAPDYLLEHNLTFPSFVTGGSPVGTYDQQPSSRSAGVEPGSPTISLAQLDAHQKRSEGSQGVKLESPTLSCATPPATQQNQTHGQPQATSFLEMLYSTDMLFPTQLAPTPQLCDIMAALPERASAPQQSVLGWAEDWAAKEAFQAGFDMAMSLAMGPPSAAPSATPEMAALAMDLPPLTVPQPAAAKSEVSDFDAFFYASAQAASSAGSLQVAGAGAGAFDDMWRFSM